MATIRDEKDKVPLASTSCPGCKAIVVNGSDKFCRICGMRVLMACIKCQQSVRYVSVFLHTQCSNGSF